jgi:hypothetical protein
VSSRLLIAAHASHKTLEVYQVSLGDPNHPLLFFQTGSITEDIAELQQFIQLIILHQRQTAKVLQP